MRDDTKLRADLAPRPEPSDSAPIMRTPGALPSITVCIVTHDRPHYVRSCLEGLRAQTVGLDAFDIILVDSCGMPATGVALRRLVATLPNARLLRIDRPGISVARNLGAE